MAKFLKDLLATDHPLFTINLQELEHATDNAGIDVRLIADITETAHRVLRELQLDPADTHGEELYWALASAVKSGKAESLLRGTEFVLLSIDETPVSFNLQDVIENTHHELPYLDRTVAHGQRHLRAEIVRRYAEYDESRGELVHALAKQAGLKPESDEGHQSMEPHTDSTQKPYIVAIGDIFTDAFIMLSEESARIDTDPDGSKRLSLPYGSKPPYDHVDIVKSVGPSPNASVSLSRLGHDVSLVAWLGDDVPGKESLEHLVSEGVDTSLMVTQPGMKSSYWYVLRYQSDRTMLVRSEPYEYKWQAPEKTPDYIYLSYIGKDSWQLHEDLVAYLNEHPDVKLIFQPGTFHFQWGVEKLAELYKCSYLTVMNREEAMDVTGKPHESIRELANGLHALGSKIVVITDGPNGSYASYDGKVVTVPNYPDPAPPLDRTGAGDAFASTIVAALAMGEPMDTALLWAPINSMSVVQQMGAQAGLLHKQDILHHLADAPDWYKVSEVQD
jgi:ribokinase